MALILLSAQYKIIAARQRKSNVFTPVYHSFHLGGVWGMGEHDGPSCLAAWSHVPSGVPSLLDIHIKELFALRRQRQIISIYFICCCQPSVNTTTCCHDTHFFRFCCHHN